ncbi:hypothetical protein TDB9533_00009 [Thalassocella blandensis]|nr:hypothetical protein TDB9533_00009 [Thalassocella blandensis]
MKSINFAATPYLSDAPLCELTDWLAIKLTIIGKSSAYSAALAKVKDINEKLEKVCEQVSTNDCQYVSDNDAYGDLAPCLDLQTSQEEHTVTLHKNLVLELSEDLNFWQKMEAITQFIDEITKYCDQFKSDKVVEIKIGCENTAIAV